MCTQTNGPMGKSKALVTALNNKLLGSHEHLDKGLFSPPPCVATPSSGNVTSSALLQKQSTQESLLTKLRSFCETGKRACLSFAARMLRHALTCCHPKQRAESNRICGGECCASSVLQALCSQQSANHRRPAWRIRSARCRLSVSAMAKCSSFQELADHQCYQRCRKACLNPDHFLLRSIVADLICFISDHLSAYVSVNYLFRYVSQESRKSIFIG